MNDTLEEDALQWHSCLGFSKCLKNMPEIIKEYLDYIEREWAEEMNWEDYSLAVDRLSNELNPKYQPLKDWEVDILNAKEKFITKDSGAREVKASGYTRDTQDGKPKFNLLLPVGIPYGDQFLTRVAELLARGATKYSPRNWELANDATDLDRYKESAFRHMIQFLTGETDEDHAAAVVFNLLGHETLAHKLAQERESM